MHEAILIALIPFAIFMVVIFSKFISLFLSDSSKQVNHLQQIKCEVKKRELKQLVIGFACVSIFGWIIGGVMIVSMLIISMQEQYRNSLPDYVPEQIIYAELNDFSKEVKRLIDRKENEHGFPKFLSSRYIDVSFWENTAFGSNRYHEIIDIERGLRVAGFVEQTSSSRKSGVSTFINAKLFTYNDFPVFVVRRNKNYLIKGGAGFKHGDWRHVNDYWFVQPNQLPIKIDPEISPGYFPDLFESNYVKLFKDGLKLISLTDNGYIEKAVWKNGDGFDLSGIRTNDYRISRLSDNVYLLLIKGDFHWYFLIKKESGSIVRKFDIEDMSSIAPREFIEAYREKENDTGFLMRPEVYSRDDNGKLILSFCYCNNAFFEFDMNDLAEGGLVDIFKYLGPHDDNYFIRDAVHGNQKLIFQKRSDADEVANAYSKRILVSVSQQQHAPKEDIAPLPHRVWEVDSFFVNERNEDGSLGEMQPLDWSALLKITNDRLWVLFPPDLENTVVIYQGYSFWTMNLDGTGLKKVFPSDDEVNQTDR